jgi:fructokinase
MITVIGEILIDHFPEYERIGGAPFNFAFHLKNMGWPVQFTTRIGDDDDGEKISRMLELNGFDLKNVQIDKSHATGRVEVTLDTNGVPSFNICEDVAYDHIDLSSNAAIIENSDTVDMVYFGTLIQRTDYGFDQVQRILKASAESTTRFCDINFRAPHINVDAIEPSLHHADILKLNDEELAMISQLCKGPPHRANAIDWLMQNYHISVIALTHGAKGSTAFTKGKSIQAPPLIIPDIIDTVGAGDAFASVLAAGALTHLPMDHTLGLAGNFAADVCRFPGAIPTDKRIYASLINEFERNSDAPK